MKFSSLSKRRGFLRGLTLAGVAVLGFSPGATVGAEKEEEEVSPSEDLMREHGVLKRVLLIYREAARRLEAKEELPPEALGKAAKIIRNFIEDYHEKLEEDFLFPRLERANRLVDLVKTLRGQHVGGRQVTDVTLRLATAEALKNEGDRARLTDSIRQFVRMYEPHEAREDTVLFPAFRKVVTAHEYAALGEDFEKKEHQLFGEDGFETMVNKVAEVEKQLGIYELDQFTPKISTEGR
jgi:hemerythrin-like domain-containing protein